MPKYFIPCTGQKPAVISIKGHRLVVLSKDREVLSDDLNLLGADRIRFLQVGKAREDDAKVLTRIAKKANAGLVIAPQRSELREVIDRLESELPWLQ